MVRDLLRGDRSNSELRAALPALSNKVLPDRLAQLVQAGVVERDRRPDWPPWVRYALTPRGHSLGPVLQALWDWGAETSARGSGAGSPMRRALFRTRPRLVHEPRHTAAPGGTCPHTRRPRPQRFRW
ncbi:winged helix-turn-helix transcriptional regulator [Streptomyces nigra]